MSQCNGYEKLIFLQIVQSHLNSRNARNVGKLIAILVGHTWILLYVIDHVVRCMGGSVAEWVSVLYSGAEGPEFKSFVGKLFTPIVPLFTKQQNW